MSMKTASHLHHLDRAKKNQTTRRHTPSTATLNGHTTSSSSSLQNKKTTSPNNRKNGYSSPRKPSKPTSIPSRKLRNGKYRKGSGGTETNPLSSQSSTPKHQFASRLNLTSNRKPTLVPRGLSPFTKRNQKTTPTTKVRRTLEKSRSAAKGSFLPPVITKQKSNHPCALASDGDCNKRTNDHEKSFSQSSLQTDHNSNCSPPLASPKLGSRSHTTLESETTTSSSPSSSSLSWKQKTEGTTSSRHHDSEYSPTLELEDEEENMSDNALYSKRKKERKNRLGSDDKGSDDKGSKQQFDFSSKNDFHYTTSTPSTSSSEPTNTQKGGMYHSKKVEKDAHETSHKDAVEMNTRDSNPSTPPMRSRPVSQTITSNLNQCKNTKESDHSKQQQQQESDDNIKTANTSSSHKSSLCNTPKEPDISIGLNSVITPKASSFLLPFYDTHKPSGLRNLGNTCYLNAVLQCLAHCRSLQNHLHGASSSSSTTHKSTQLAKYGPANDYMSAVKAMWGQSTSPVNTSTKPRSTTGVYSRYSFSSLVYSSSSSSSSSYGTSCYSPSKIKQHLSSVSPQFMGWRQNDAQEALQYLLNIVHNAMNCGDGHSSLSQQAVERILVAQKMTCNTPQGDGLNGKRPMVPRPPSSRSATSSKTSSASYRQNVSSATTTASSSSILTSSSTSSSSSLTTEKLSSNKQFHRRFVKESVNNTENSLVPKGRKEQISWLRKQIDLTMDDSAKFLLTRELALLFDNSAVYDACRGWLKCTRVCYECDHVDVTFEHFLDVSVPIPSANSKFPSSIKSYHLTDCLDDFVTNEDISGEEAPFCDGCKKKCSARRQMMFASLPSTLIIHLKRFQFKGYGSRKITNFVDVPTEIDMSPFAQTHDGGDSAGGKGLVYSLCGATLHSGSVNGGHYTALCKHPKSGDWFYCNDSSVTKSTPPPNHHMHAAYLLFYERV
eukprot:m.121868 g.121868  ORF g.121868 m.121868 type:complete len:945 (+) comp12930_c0_seq1:193-3027(+)